MRTYTLLGFLLATTFIVISNGERCSDCVHLDYTVSGLRTISRALLDSLLLDTYNPNCLHDNKDMQIECSQNTSQGMVMKCKKTNVVVQARGILGVELDAEVNLLAVERRCALVNASQENICISHMEDTSVSSYISQTLTHLTNTWNTVNYTGANCFSDPHLDVIQREPVNVTLFNATNENETEPSVTLFNATNETETEPSSLSEESSRTDIQEKVRKFVHLFQNYNGTQTISSAD
uniref:Uncharacterized protein LOC111122628 n=1 Tax=Crassostrea virginica TaxID=6565 RepID=A0A8B8CWI1_CRAVI|nr:uncharacterized protein LOC111122628 [Crassostrea virginica]